jgi:hypothetical protein
VSGFLDVVDQTIESVARLKKTLSKASSKQVRGSDEIDLMKATALSWIKSQRPTLGAGITAPALDNVDAAFRQLLEFSARHTTRARCKAHLKSLQASLVALRSDFIANPQPYATNSAASAAPPDWSALIPDAGMQAILNRRWQETTNCMRASAPLASTVMMGALLEGLLLARINRLQDKSAVFKANSAPKDKKTAQTLPLSKWTLHDYIDVAHELSWIRQPARDVSVVLRDYRNYIHPAKELSQGHSMNDQDASMFWVVFQSLAQQILKLT